MKHWHVYTCSWNDFNICYNMIERCKLGTNSITLSSVGSSMCHDGLSIIIKVFSRLQLLDTKATKYLAIIEGSYCIKFIIAS